MLARKYSEEKNNVWKIMNMHGRCFEWEIVYRRRICRREMLGTRHSTTTKFCMSGTRRNITASSISNWSGAKEKADRESTNMERKEDYRNKLKELVVSVAVNDQ